jgi:hypothetical protein
MRPAERLVEGNPQGDFEVFAAVRAFFAWFDGRLEQLAETLTSSRTGAKVEALEGERRVFTERLALDHTAVVSTSAFGVRKNFECLRDESKHGRGFGASRMEIGMKLTSASLIGAPKLRRRKTPVHPENRIKIRHDLSVSRSIIAEI